MTMEFCPRAYAIKYACCTNQTMLIMMATVLLFYNIPNPEAKLAVSNTVLHTMQKCVMCI